MDSASAKPALSTMWTLVHTAQDRPLNEAERLELQRACELIARGATGEDKYAELANALCSAIQTSGVFEGGVAKEGAVLLKAIDSLHDFLEQPGTLGAT